MEPPPRGPAAWPLTCLLLLALPRCPGVGAQAHTELQQPQDEVLVMAGQTLNLTCTVSRGSSPGTVRWLKGWGSGSETVYDQKSSNPRVIRVQGGSNTDFSIRIRDARPEDAGTYYCVMFRKRLPDGEEVSHRGKGTKVSVYAQPTPPVVSGPSHRAGTGQSVSVTCTAGGFFPKDIAVKWFKDGAPISAQQPQVTPGGTNSSYNVSSTVTVTLQKDDVRSQLVCEVQHLTLSDPLRGTYQLSKALRVSPNVSVVPDLLSSEVNRTVNFTCNVMGFYPREVAVTWLENGTEVKVENISQLVETPQGLFYLRSLVEVNVTEEKNGSMITCRVVHDAQDPISVPATLRIAVPAKEASSDSSQAGNENLLLIYIVVGVVCTVLVLLVAAILYLIRAKQSKAGKSSPSARLHEPEKSSEATTQESDPNNLTYADLNFDREKKIIRRMAEMSQQSEYACIQTNQAPAGDDNNLTYADLDMVHLSKAPKRPCPEESVSEYASVQIARK